jgi:hypothetical protein
VGGGEAGRPSFDPVMLFKMFVIQTTNNIADERRQFRQLEASTLTDSESRGPPPLRNNYAVRFGHQQEGLVWISNRQTAVKRDLRHMSKDSGV